MEFENRVWKSSSFACIQPADALEEVSHDLHIAPGFAGRFRTLEMPLQPAAGIHERSFFFSKAGRRQAEYFRLYFGGVYVVELAMVLPEIGCFRRQRID